MWPDKFGTDASHRQEFKIYEKQTGVFGLTVAQVSWVSRVEMTNHFEVLLT
jgi:hypothetical protein